MKKIYLSTDYFTDEHILDLIDQKDHTGYTLLYKKYWTKLVSYAYSLVEEYDTAKEIVQNLLVNFFTHDIRVKSKFGLYAYLHTAVRNRVANHYRSCHNYRKHVTTQRLNGTVSTDVIMAPIYFGELRREIRKCLNRLPKKYAEVFILNRENFLTVKEIAVELKRPEGTVEKQLRKSLQYLRENLDIETFIQVDHQTANHSLCQES